MGWGHYFARFGREPGTVRSKAVRPEDSQCLPLREITREMSSLKPGPPEWALGETSSVPRDRHDHPRPKLECVYEGSLNPFLHDNRSRGYGTGQFGRYF
jgi:hypothetical protein